MPVQILVRKLDRIEIARIVSRYPDSADAFVVEEYEDSWLVRLKADPVGNTHPDCVKFVPMIQEIADADAAIVRQEVVAQHEAAAEEFARAKAEAESARKERERLAAEAARRAKDDRNKR